ncbi:MAG TPA: hypothetical protein VFX89_02980 [Gammaproteobacteria bacterium]|nr:hypothetical protein [Gammaproteobacteria bacterium]
MRASLLLVLVCAAAAAQDYKSSTVLDSHTFQRQKTAVSLGGFPIGGTSVDMNRVTVVLDGYDVTGEFPSETPRSPKAGDVKVGSDIFAALDRSKLLLKWPDGSIVTAKVVVRQKHKQPRDSQARD